MKHEVPDPPLKRIELMIEGHLTKRYALAQISNAYALMAVRGYLAITLPLPALPYPDTY